MENHNSDSPKIDLVIIGVNTDRSLGACLDSILASNYPADLLQIYYVDGGSSDQSLSIAGDYEEVETINLAAIYPTPGLGRNAGWRAGTAPLVQFLDSDTLLDPEWLAQAVAELEGNDQFGAVCGNRNETRPQASFYNWIGDLEWNSPPGDVDAFGGDVMIRRQVLDTTDGYDEILVGGEDPELSVRIRLQGWIIRKLDVTMTGHDLAMTRFSQYWRRSYRTGYGFAAVFLRHAKNLADFWRKEFMRILIRGGGTLSLILLGLLGLPYTPYAALLGLPALLLLCTPRLFRVTALMAQKQLTLPQARLYAWHCSFIVVPQFFGIVRFLLGKATHRPLRNRSRKLGLRATPLLQLTILLLLFVLPGCVPEMASLSPQPTPAPEPELPQPSAPTVEFEPRITETDDVFSAGGDIEALSQELSNTYLLGAGDILSLTVWNRPELAVKSVTVGPDGVISIPRIGFVNVKGRNREELRKEITDKLARLYENPEVTLSILEYHNNKAFVLGRVTNPGVVSFPGEGTLLEALSLAGGLPIIEREDASFLQKCAIIRGRDKIIWIDLDELLNNGNMALNARIRNNDVIFIPESKDELVYVMGEVENPGAVRLRNRLSYLDALMLVGGPTKNASLTKTFLIRGATEQGTVKEVNLKQMLETGSLQENFLLKSGDVLFVSASGAGKWNYAFQQVLPFMQVMDLSTSSLERFGVMRELRQKLWGKPEFQ